MSGVFAGQSVEIVTQPLLIHTLEGQFDYLDSDSRTPVDIQTENKMLMQEFKKKSSDQRREYVESKQIGLNDLSRYRVSACPSTKWYHKCFGKHHSILHGSSQLLSSTVHNT